MFLFCFVLFCSVFFLLIFQADTSSILFHLVAKNVILHIFLIIMIIIPCSGMFRNVPECSMFLVLSTAENNQMPTLLAVSQIYDFICRKVTSVFYWPLHVLGDTQNFRREISRNRSDRGAGSYILFTL